MRYYVSLDPSPNAAPVVVDLVDRPSGELEAHVDGRRVEIDVVDVGGRISARVDGRVIDLTTEGKPPEMGAVAGGHRSYVKVHSERMRSAEQARGGTPSAGDRIVKSPMPGRVVKLLVAQGDRVQSGQGLVVLEAMKMENEVRARISGAVAEVHVTAGAAVEANAKLVTLT